MKKNTKIAKLKLIRRFVAWGLMILLIVALHQADAFHRLLGILPKIQFGQSMAGFFSHGALTSVVIFLTLAALTLIFGRFFCGFLCPLGALMDLTVFVRSKVKRRPFTYVPSRLYRIFLPALLLIAFWIGFPYPYSQLEPYSLFVSGHELLLLVILLAVFKGRAYCELLCPTGLVLRLFSNQSLLAFRLDQASCLNCGACQKACPASCLDAPNKSVDRGRCLLCLECASVCPNGSLKYGLAKGEKPRPGRRGFIKLAGAAALAAGAHFTGEGLRAKTFGQPEKNPILPPGALSLAHFNAHCTLCHTCVSACPNRALQPSHSTTPVLTAKPLLSPYDGFCQYDCLVCGQVCPSGALLPLSLDSKHVTRLGLAALDRPECVVVKNGTSCGACAELCPTGAVRMAPGPSGRDEPTMDQDYCVGCGACQKACPVRPIAAIVVTGLTIQQTAKVPKVVITEDLTLTDDFPF
ncbi:MAG: 4Fe-4S binding protein [Deltaproteobacteria bacterium]|jgi:polyferredoxin|nr:4Fe-4S binding protein [Deltaproteobacteria bacterium]